MLQPSVRKQGFISDISITWLFVDLSYNESIEKRTSFNLIFGNLIGCIR